MQMQVKAGEHTWKIWQVSFNCQVSFISNTCRNFTELTSRIQQLEGVMHSLSSKVETVSFPTNVTVVDVQLPKEPERPSCRMMVMIIDHHHYCDHNQSSSSIIIILTHINLIILIIIKPALYMRHRRRQPRYFLLSRSPSCRGLPPHHLQQSNCFIIYAVL